jgi:uncharacterized protein YoxC
MSDSAFKLQLLVRAELALAKIYARRSMIGAASVAAALIFVLMGLGMLNYAAYVVLLERYTPGMAALLVAMADAICAVAIAVLGSRVGASVAEEKMAKQIRDMAYNEVGKDVEEVKLRIDQLTDEVKNISAGVSTVMGTLKFFVGLLGKTVKKKTEGK